MRLATLLGIIPVVAARGGHEDNHSNMTFTPDIKVPDCEEMNQEFCNLYAGEGAEDCCIVDCVAEYMDVFSCLILEAFGVDRTDCAPPECDVSAFPSDSSSQTISKAAKAVTRQVPDFAWESFAVLLTPDAASAACPSEWSQFISCIITECPQFVEVCPTRTTETFLREFPKKKP